MEEMQKMTFICLLLLFVLCCSSVNAEGKYGAEFLQQLASAESNGMGESTVAYSIGARALNNNPAGLSFGMGNELLVGSYISPRVSATILEKNGDELWEDYGKYEIERTEMTYINFAIPPSKGGNIGVSLAFNHGGRFIRVNEEGKAINAFPRDDLLLGIGYSVKLTKGFAFGLDAKALRSKLPTDKGSQIGRTYAMNVGFMHQINDKARIGASLQNIGNKLSFKMPDIPDKLRRDFEFGALYNIINSKKSNLSVSFDINPPFDNGLRYSVGTELLYSQRLAFRIGYIRDTQPYYDSFFNMIDGASVKEKRVWIRKGITIGAGLKLKNADVNIAMTPSREPDLSDEEKLRLDDQKSIISFSFSARF
jgi:hypothetical protein